MSLWIIIPVLLTGILVVYTWMQRRYQGSGSVRVPSETPILRNEALTVSATNSPDMVALPWWKALSPLQQLHLALYLAESAMPVWEKFTSGQEVSYRVVPAGPLVVIQHTLLQKAASALSRYLQGNLSSADSGNIGHYHKQFIDPVLALKDGVWVCSYPVKKIFLSVYYMLMSVGEGPGALLNPTYTTAAIQAVLECLEMSKIYTPEEVASMLDVYRCSM